jgi:hypothetical protein
MQANARMFLSNSVFFALKNISVSSLLIAGIREMPDFICGVTNDLT